MFRLWRRHGTGYIYPHDVPGGYAVQQYLPDSVLGHQFYEPTRHGVEAKLADRLAKLRGETKEAQASDEAADQRS
jgi:putative ATPase